jgi:hypothetical protein
MGIAFHGVPITLQGNHALQHEGLGSIDARLVHPRAKSQWLTLVYLDLLSSGQSSMFMRRGFRLLHLNFFYIVSLPSPLFISTSFVFYYLYLHHFEEYVKWPKSQSI